MKPFIKYPGGKTKEIPVVLKFLPNKFKRYIEPFVGGGSIFFALNIHPSFINDKSTDLYFVYKLIQEQNLYFKHYLVKMDICWKILEHKDFLTRINDYDFINKELFKNYYFSSLKRKENSVVKLESKGKVLSEVDKKKMEITARKDAFYKVIRDIYNDKKIKNELHAAAYYFLREYCYSSMFRFSSKGKFNVPYGGMSYNDKCMEMKIEYMFSKEMSSYLKHVIIGNEDFEVFLNSINLLENDFIFLDPPYDTDFSTYDNNPFDKDEQIRLRDYLKQTKAKWMLIIKKTDFIYNLYKDFVIKEYDMNYMVSFKNRNSRETKHLIIMNYEVENG